MSFKPDEEIRLCALDRAIGRTHPGEQSVEEILKAAEQFESFIIGCTPSEKAE